MLLHSELFEVCLVSTEGNLKAKSYSSLSERGQESIQGLGCLSGEVSYGTYIPDLYVCGFTHVAYVLRHAESRVQGYTEVLYRRHKWDIGVSDVNDSRQRTVRMQVKLMLVGDSCHSVSGSQSLRFAVTKQSTYCYGQEQSLEGP